MNFIIILMSCFLVGFLVGRVGSVIMISLLSPYKNKDLKREYIGIRLTKKGNYKLKKRISEYNKTRNRAREY